jgi:hypothetical protein
MSIDNCQGCDKRLDTDFVEYQVDGSLYCDNCLDEMELEPVAEQGTDWKALAGELAEALSEFRQAQALLNGWKFPSAYGDIDAKARAALAKYEQEVRA